MSAEDESPDLGELMSDIEDDAEDPVQMLSGRQMLTLMVLSFGLLVLQAAILAKVAVWTTGAFGFIPAVVAVILVLLIYQKIFT